MPSHSYPILPLSTPVSSTPVTGTHSYILPSTISEYTKFPYLLSVETIYHRHLVPMYSSMATTPRQGIPAANVTQRLPQAVMQVTMAELPHNLLLSVRAVIKPNRVLSFALEFIHRGDSTGRGRVELIVRTPQPFKGTIATAERHIEHLFATIRSSTAPMAIYNEMERLKRGLEGHMESRFGMDRYAFHDVLTVNGGGEDLSRQGSGCTVTFTLPFPRPVPAN